VAKKNKNILEEFVNHDLAVLIDEYKSIKSRLDVKLKEISSNKNYKWFGEVQEYLNKEGITAEDDVNKPWYPREPMARLKGKDNNFELIIGFDDPFTKYPKVMYKIRYRVDYNNHYLVLCRRFELNEDLLIIRNQMSASLVNPVKSEGGTTLHELDWKITEVWMDELDFEFSLCDFDSEMQPLLEMGAVISKENLNKFVVELTYLCEYRDLTNNEPN